MKKLESIQVKFLKSATLKSMYMYLLGNDVDEKECRLLRKFIKKKLSKISYKALIKYSYYFSFRDKSASIFLQAIEENKKITDDQKFKISMQLMYYRNDYHSNGDATKDWLENYLKMRLEKGKISISGLQILIDVFKINWPPIIIGNFFCGNAKIIKIAA